MTNSAIARSLELQRLGWRVVVQQEKSEVTVYLGRREAPIEHDSRATARTLSEALELAAAKAGAWPRRNPRPIKAAKEGQW